MATKNNKKHTKFAQILIRTSRFVLRWCKLLKKDHCNFEYGSVWLILPVVICFFLKKNPKKHTKFAQQTASPAKQPKCT